MEEHRSNDQTYYGRGRVIASLDPGGTTGMVIHECGLYTTKLELETLPQVYEILNQNMPTDVVYETFTHRMSGGSHQLVAVEVIGVIKLWIGQHRHRVINIRAQPPSMKRPYRPEILKRAGLYWSGHQHANDAAMHLMAYEHFQKLDCFTSALSPRATSSQ